MNVDSNPSRLERSGCVPIRRFILVGFLSLGILSAVKAVSLSRPVLWNPDHPANLLQAVLALVYFLTAAIGSLGLRIGYSLALGSAIALAVNQSLVLLRVTIHGFAAPRAFVVASLVIILYTAAIIVSLSLGKLRDRLSIGPPMMPLALATTICVICLLMWPI